MSKEQAYLLYLIKCAIVQSEVKLPKVSIDWMLLAEYAEQQQFEQILFPLFKNNEHGFDAKTWFHLQQRYGLSITRDTEQDIELCGICDAFSEKGIRHVPLKGSSVKAYYCYPEIRMSADMDILIDWAAQENAFGILYDMGYTPELEYDDAEHHDVLSKGNFHVELHKDLLTSESTARDLSNMVWDYVETENGYTYRMNETFLYVYLLEHLRKHLLQSGGAGIKLITDIYVMNLNANINNDLLKRLLGKANMSKFNRYVQLLIRRWFCNENIDDENVLIMEDLILNSGAYGDFSAYVKIRYSDEATDSLRNGIIVKYIKRIFPGMRFMKKKYPLLEKHPWCLPFMWLVRIFNANIGYTKSTAEVMYSMENEELKKLKVFKENILK